MSALVNYSSSDESEEDQQVGLNKASWTNSEGNVDDLKKGSLPVPDDIRGLFTDKNSGRKVDSNPVNHGGRIRSFPHEEGNWATSVFAKYDTDEHFKRLQEELFTCLRPLEFHPMEDYHISLSRTVTIRHHWIQDISDSLAKQFSHHEGCCCEIDGLNILTNDEKTRSFLTLLVTSADDMLQSYVAEVDTCFQEYNLEKYYVPPLFHVSIGWCLGDVTEDVSHKTKQKLQEILNQALQENTDMKYFYIDELHMKTGNKSFVFQLGVDT